MFSFEGVDHWVILHETGCFSFRQMVWLRWAGSLEQRHKAEAESPVPFRQPVGLISSVPHSLSLSLICFCHHGFRGHLILLSHEHVDFKEQAQNENL